MGIARKAEVFPSGPASADLHPGPGFRVRLEIERVDATLAARFASFDTPDVSDVLNRLYTLDHGIRHLTGAPRLYGPAVTVKVFPGDNLMVHKALDVLRPGDVIVVDAGGSTLNGVLGDMVGNKAKHRGAAGFVVDGLVRDLPGLIDTGLTIYARGVTPIGPLHRGPGEVNHSVSCGGIVVNPGDLVLGDTNGIVIVRREFAAELIDVLEARRTGLAGYVADVRRGKFSNDWVDAALAALACRIED